MTEAQVRTKVIEKQKARGGAAERMYAELLKDGEPPHVRVAALRGLALAKGDAGAAYLFRGGPAGSVATPAWTFLGTQTGAALGAAVVAVDPSAERRALVAGHGASLGLDPSQGDARALKSAVRQFAEQRAKLAGARVGRCGGVEFGVAGDVDARGILAHLAHTACCRFIGHEMHVSHLGDRMPD